MNTRRRTFIKKGLFALLAVSLLPPSISYLKRGDFSFSVNELLAQLSFKRRLFSSGYLAKKFPLLVEETDNVSRKGKVFYANKTYCFHEMNHYSPDFKNSIVSFYEKTSNGFEKVISLNEIELKAMLNMVGHLKKEHKMSDPKELQGCLLPTFRSEKHQISDKRVDGLNSSQHGYYTEHGYCSMQIKAKGNRYRIDTKLLNFNKDITYQSKATFQVVV